MGYYLLLYSKQKVLHFYLGLVFLWGFHVLCAFLYWVSWLFILVIENIVKFSLVVLAYTICFHLVMLYETGEYD